MADEHHQTVLDNMKRLHLDPKWSDMTITCEGQEFKVHRNIIATQSDVIDAELSSNFRESTGVIQHDEYDLKTVERMIKYLYTRDYNVTTSLPSSDEDTSEPSIVPDYPVTESLIAHANVHAIASYYNIPRLKIKAVEKFEAILRNEVPAGEAKNLISLLEVVYKQPKSEDAGLRPAIVAECMHHLGYLISDEHLTEDFKDKDLLTDCCLEIIACLAFSLKAVADKLTAAQATSAAQVLDGDRTVDQLRNSLAQEQRKVSEAEGGLATVTKLLGGLNKCYRCKTEIDLTISRGGKHGRGKYFVRCSCGAKHNAP